jgi:hypothetical protein
MQVNIDFSPQISEQLAQAARVRGTDPAKVLESLIAEYLPPVTLTSGNSSDPRYRTPQEHIAAMDAVAEKYANAPILPDSAFDRENIYEDEL